MSTLPEHSYQDVAAVITAMTDSEQPFLFEAVAAALGDPGIAQVVLCVEENNAWVDQTLNSLTQDARLQILRIPMALLAAVRGRGLEEVRFPWVAYCDGDDVWRLGKTQAQRAWAEQTNADFVGADHCLVNEQTTVCAFAMSHYLPMPSSWMVRTEVMRQYPFRDLPNMTEDIDWWFRTGDRVKKVRCPKTLLNYRVRSVSLSTNAPSKERKARIVALASLPILRQIALFCTWCAWLSRRRGEYVWFPGWGRQSDFESYRKSDAIEKGSI